MNNLFKLKGTKTLLLLENLKSTLYNNGYNNSSNIIINSLINHNNNNNSNNNNIRYYNTQTTTTTTPIQSTTTTTTTPSTTLTEKQLIRQQNRIENETHERTRKEEFISHIPEKLKILFFPNAESEKVITKSYKRIVKVISDAHSRFSNAQIVVNSIKEIKELEGYDVKYSKYLFDTIEWNKKNITSGYLGFFIDQFSNDKEYLEKVMKMYSDNNLTYSITSYTVLLQHYIKVDNKVELKQMVEKLVVSNKMDELSSIYITLIESCLHLDDIQSALAFYNRLLASPLRFNYQVFYKFLNYYLNKDNEEGANSAVKFFMRFIKSVPQFIQSQYFPEILARLLITYYPDSGFFGRQVVENILEIVNKRGMISNDSFYFNIILYFIQPTIGQYDFAHQLYIDKIKSKSLNTMEVHLKTIKYLIATNRISELKEFLENVKFPIGTISNKDNSKFDYYCIQALLEFAQFNNRSDLYPLILNLANYKKYHLIIAYNDLTDNQELVAVLEDHLANHHQKLNDSSLLTATLSQLIQTYLSLNYYHLALFWLSKKITLYKSSTSPILMNYFLEFHKKQSNKDLIEFWDSHILLKSLESEITKTTIVSSKNSNNNKHNNNKDEVQVITNTIGRNKQTSIERNLNGLKNEIESNWLFFETFLKNAKSLKEIEKSKSVPFESYLNGLCLSGNVDAIIGELERHFENSTIPSQWFLLQSYCTVSRLDSEKYVYLLNQTPRHIRNIVYDPRAYKRLFELDFDLAIKVLSNESVAILQTHTIHNVLLEALCKINQIDLASMVVAKIIGTSKKNQHEELFLEMMIKNKRHNDPIVSSLKDQMVKMSKVSPVLCNIEIMKLLECGAYDEAFQIFNAAPKNSQSLLLGLQIFSKKYPIPPISNLMYWGSLMEIEKSIDSNGRTFFEYFYQILYENNLSHIVLLYASKSTPSFSNITAKELHWILLSTPDERKRIEIFNQWSGNQLSQETVTILNQTNESVRNQQVQDRLDSKITIIKTSSNLDYKKISNSSIEYIIYNFTPFLPETHTFKIDNTNSSCNIYLNETSSLSSY